VIPGSPGPAGRDFIPQSFDSDGTSGTRWMHLLLAGGEGGSVLTGDGEVSTLAGAGTRVCRRSSFRDLAVAH
jgi:hypothetical protein